MYAPVRSDSFPTQLDAGSFSGSAAVAAAGGHHKRAEPSHADALKSERTHSSESVETQSRNQWWGRHVATHEQQKLGEICTRRRKRTVRKPGPPSSAAGSPASPEAPWRPCISACVVARWLQAGRSWVSPHLDEFVRGGTWWFAEPGRRLTILAPCSSLSVK